MDSSHAAHRAIAISLCLLAPIMQYSHYSTLSICGCVIYWKPWIQWTIETTIDSHDKQIVSITAVVHSVAHMYHTCLPEIWYNLSSSGFGLQLAGWRQKAAAWKNEHKSSSRLSLYWIGAYNSYCEAAECMNASISNRMPCDEHTIRKNHSLLCGAELGNMQSRKVETIGSRHFLDLESTGYGVLHYWFTLYWHEFPVVVVGPIESQQKCLSVPHAFIDRLIGTQQIRFKWTHTHTHAHSTKCLESGAAQKNGQNRFARYLRRCFCYLPPPTK